MNIQNPMSFNLNMFNVNMFSVNKICKHKLLKPLSKALACAVLIISSFDQASFAQSYPTKPITLIAPFAPGGNVDIVARALAQSLSSVTGQSVVVDNKAGAGGGIGSAFVANAPADGYTLLVATTNTVSVLPFMVKNPTYKPTSFQPVGLLAISPLLVEVRADDKRFPDLKSFLEFARKSDQSISMGHSGQGTSNHVAILKIEEGTHVNFNIIPYKGSTPALTDLMGGQLDAVVDQITSSKSFIDSGKLRVLAVLSPERETALPLVPTFKELTNSPLQANTTTGLLAPVGTPQTVINALNAALKKVEQDPAFINRLNFVGSIAKTSTPKEWGDILAAEAANSKRLVDMGKLKVE